MSPARTPVRSPDRSEERVCLCSIDPFDFESHVMEAEHSVYDPQTPRKLGNGVPQESSRLPSEATPARKPDFEETGLVVATHAAEDLSTKKDQETPLQALVSGEDSAKPSGTDHRLTLGEGRPRTSRISAGTTDGAASTSREPRPSGARVSRSKDGAATPKLGPAMKRKPWRAGAPNVRSRSLSGGRVRELSDATRSCGKGASVVSTARPRRELPMSAQDRRAARLAPRGEDPARDCGHSARQEVQAGIEHGAVGSDVPCETRGSGVKPHVEVVEERIPDSKPPATQGESCQKAGSSLVERRLSASAAPRERRASGTQRRSSAPTTIVRLGAKPCVVRMECPCSGATPVAVRDPTRGMSAERRVSSTAAGASTAMHCSLPLERRSHMRPEGTGHLTPTPTHRRNKAQVLATGQTGSRPQSPRSSVCTAVPSSVSPSRTRQLSILRVEGSPRGSVTVQRTHSPVQIPVTSPQVQLSPLRTQSASTTTQYASARGSQTSRVVPETTRSSPSTLKENAVAVSSGPSSRVPRSAGSKWLVDGILNHSNFSTSGYRHLTRSLPCDGPNPDTASTNLGSTTPVHPQRLRERCHAEPDAPNVQEVPWRTDAEPLLPASSRIVAVRELSTEEFEARKRLGPTHGKFEKRVSVQWRWVPDD